MGSPAAGWAAGLAATWAAGLAALLVEGLARGLAALGADLAEALAGGSSPCGKQFASGNIAHEVQFSIGKNICQSSYTMHTLCPRNLSVLFCNAQHCGLRALPFTSQRIQHTRHRERCLFNFLINDLVQPANAQEQLNIRSSKYICKPESDGSLAPVLCKGDYYAKRGGYTPPKHCAPGPLCPRDPVCPPLAQSAQNAGQCPPAPQKRSPNPPPPPPVSRGAVCTMTQTEPSHKTSIVTGGKIAIGTVDRWGK